MLNSMAIAVLIASALVVASIFTSFLSFRFGAPLLLVFLGLGLLAGEDGLGGIAFNNGPAAFFVGSIALAIILFDSGFETRLATLRMAAAPALALATAGVLLTTVLVAAAARVLYGFAWPECLLLGAIVAPTDAAAVFFLLRVGGIALRDRVRSTLEIESGSNDPVAIFLTISLLGVAVVSPTAGSTDPRPRRQHRPAGRGRRPGRRFRRAGHRRRGQPHRARDGALSDRGHRARPHRLGRRQSCPRERVPGGLCRRPDCRQFPHAPRRGLKRFQRGITWLSQIAMFLTLGLLATPSQFRNVAVAAVALAVFLTLIARPVAVWLCLLPFRFTRYEIAFVSWVGLRGAVSILLAILPVIAGMPNGQDVFNTAFIVVLVSLLVQGWTIRPMATLPRHGGAGAPGYRRPHRARAAGQRRL